MSQTLFDNSLLYKIIITAAFKCTQNISEIFLRKIKFTGGICPQGFATPYEILLCSTSLHYLCACLKNLDEKENVHRISVMRIKYSQPKPLEFI